MFCHYWYYCIYFTEYVDNIGQVLFTLPFEDMKSVFQKYSANVPEPLNRQFPERKCKDDAVKDFEARKKNTTPLFPPVSDQVALLQKASEVDSNFQTQKYSSLWEMQNARSQQTQL